MRHLNLQTHSLILAATLALSACTIPDGGRTGLRDGGPSVRQIVFNSGDFSNGPQTSVLYANTIEREEYALFKSPDRQAEFIYITTRHFHTTNVVINRIFDLETAINGFRHNQSGTRTAGQPFRVKSNGISYWAKSYQLPEQKRACAVFSGSWDHPADDLRPSKALFGYFCETATAALTKAHIENQINKVGIRGITSDLQEGAIDVPTLAETPTQDDLLLRAQGAPNSRQGNMNFPHQSVWYFKRDESCHFKPDC